MTNSITQGMNVNIGHVTDVHLGGTLSHRDTWDGCMVL